MKISALAPWAGSKRTLAPRIVEALGPHRCYWEPFCGSLAVLLAKPRCSYETVVDLHQDLINLALCVQDEDLARQLYARTYQTMFDQRLLRHSKEQLPDGFMLGERPDPDRAYWYLIRSWFGINGAAGTRTNRTGSFCVRYTSKGGSGPTRWRSVVESIPDWHERLLGVQILGTISGFTVGREPRGPRGHRRVHRPAVHRQGPAVRARLRRPGPPPPGRAAAALPRDPRRRQLLRPPAAGRALPRLGAAALLDREEPCAVGQARPAGPDRGARGVAHQSARIASGRRGGLPWESPRRLAKCHANRDPLRERCEKRSQRKRRTSACPSS